VKSFARIHETNLKKQGMLALTFVNKDDYDRIKEDDTFEINGLGHFRPGKNLELIITHSDKSTESIPVAHTYNENQIEWFKAGSALNLIRKKEGRF
jgi:aconitate hydratase